jgi:DNA repair exonuclease SbcCD ATPase subunit
MKILKIHIENFESHENTTIEFDSRFNCIVGPTNVGKTAIFNAILFALFNEWDPGFIRKGADSCKVIIHTDKFVLERVKGDNVNFVIIRKDGQEFRFDNFGKDYPDEVKRLISLPSLEDCSAFIGPQDSNSFLIHDPSTVRSAYISKVVGIDLLNEVIKEIASEIKECSNRINELERKKSDIKDRLGRLKFVDKLERLVNKSEKLEKRVNDLIERNRTLSFYRDKIKDLDKRITSIKHLLDQVDSVDFDSYLNVCTLYSEIIPKVSQLKEIDRRISSYSTSLRSVNEEIDVKVTELITLLKELARCPLCGSHLTSESIDFIFDGILEGA